jgi:hypothetical protein
VQFDYSARGNGQLQNPLSLSLSLSSRGAPRVARVLYRKPPIKHGSGGGSGSGGDCSGA